jgi:riboflavin biosynthesis pyrimidine reductase
VSQPPAFRPIEILYNAVDDAHFRQGRATVWGDLEPDAKARVEADRDGIPYTYALFIQSKDGRVIDSLKGGVGRMAGQPADRFGQLELRATVDAFLIGGGTLRADRAIGAPNYPELVERRTREKGTVAPLNVIFSASGRFPRDAPVFRAEGIDVALFVSDAAEVSVAELKELTPDVTLVDGERPLREMWQALHRRGVRTIGFEGGPLLTGLALRDHLVHELLLTHSSLVLGGSGPGFADIEQPLEGVSVQPLFLGLHEPSGLIFERSRVIYEP